MSPTNYDLAVVIRDLLAIAKVAMPDYLFEIDPRVRAGQNLLNDLNGTQHRPPSVLKPSSEPAMPYVGEADPDDPLTARIRAALDAQPAPDMEVAAALDAFLAGPDAPATRPAAIEHILRDWLIGHGYIQHRAAGDQFH